MFWILFFFVVVYLVTSVRDTIGDLRFIFERRLVRRFLTRFSLRALFWMTAIAALFFAFVQIAKIPVVDWPIIAMVLACIYGAFLLIRVAITDITFRGSRRTYRSHYLRETESNPPDPPVIRQ